MNSKISKIFAIITLFIASSCSSDSPQEETEDVTIVGKWKLESRLVGGNEYDLSNCQQGGGVIFQENLEAKFIVQDNVGIEPDITQEGYEGCDYRYATYDYVVNENNEILYTIVEGEGLERNVDDAISIYEIEVLTNRNLRIKAIARSNVGTIENIEDNRQEYDESEQVTLIYTKD